MSQQEGGHHCYMVLSEHGRGSKQEEGLGRKKGSGTQKDPQRLCIKTSTVSSIYLSVRQSVSQSSASPE